LARLETIPVGNGGDKPRPYATILPGFHTAETRTGIRDHIWENLY
jgi:hypothetical protein